MSHNARRLAAAVFVALAALLVVLLAACTSGGLPAPLLSQDTSTPAALARATVAVTLIPSGTPRPTATHTPTITPSPTITPTPTATPTVVKGIQDTSTLQDVPVARVIDGNTIEVTIKGTNYQVRYLGIAVPGNAATPEPGGADAAAKNRQLVAGQVVRLEKDVSDTDAEGRLLRYVYTKYYMVNAEMLRLGYARLSLLPPDTRYQELFAGMETEARDARRGLWGSVWAGTPVPRGTATP